MSSAITPPRRAAFEVLRRVFEHGAWADRAFGAAARRHGLAGRERAQAQHLAYGSVHRRGASDRLAETLAGRPVTELDPPLAAALRLGLFELLFAEGTPDHAAVDQAVQLAKEGTGGRRAAAAAGLVNAVLRRAAREGEPLLAALDDGTPEGAAAARSYPAWLAELWWRELGPGDAVALMDAMNEPAETALRVNALRTDPERLPERLRAAGEPVERPRAVGPLVLPEAVVVAGQLGKETRRLLDAGELVAQSRGSQAVICLLDPAPGERVLDLCAAPGIKASAIAARLRNEGEVVAVEVDPGRAGQLRELCGRLGASCVRVVEADAARADYGGGYDRVLVDPPCSDLGTLASRPDARWRKSPGTVERLATLQGRILARAAAAVRPGGTLVYATCTISARENERRVAALLDAALGLRADDLGAEAPELASRADARCLQLRPDRDRTTGFFIARLRRDAGAAAPVPER